MRFSIRDPASLQPGALALLFFVLMPLAFGATVVATVPLYAGVERRFSQPVSRPVLAPVMSRHGWAEIGVRARVAERERWRSQVSRCSHCGESS